MGTLITMRGILEPIEVDPDFVETKHAFELAAANGMRFFNVSKANGKQIAFYMSNVLYIEEPDDDSIGGFA